MAFGWGKGCFEAVTTASTHSVKECDAVVAEERVFLAVVAWKDRRDINVAGGKSAFLMAFEMGKVARCSISEQVELGEMVGSLISHTVRERDLVGLLRRTREGTEHPQEQNQCTKNDPGGFLVRKKTIIVVRHVVRRCLDAS